MRRCGRCHKPLPAERPKAQYCNDSCRSWMWKFVAGYPIPKWALKQRQNGRERRSGRSGAQVGYPKALRAAVETAVAFGIPRSSAEPVARVMVRDALPARQRARVETRS